MRFFLKPFIDLFQDSQISLEIIFFSFLIILIPIALITGPALPDIFITLVAIYFLFQTFKQNLWGYFRNPLIIGILLFCVYIFFRAIFSELPISSFSNEGSVFYFRYLLFVMGMAYLLKQNPYLSQCLLISLFFGILIVGIDAYYQYFTGFNFIGNPSIIGQKRLTGLFVDEPIVGRYLAYLAPMLFALIYRIYGVSKKTILLSITLLVFSEVIVFLSGERAPFFYISSFSLLIVIFIPNYRFVRVVGLVVTFLLIVLIMEFKPETKDRMVDTTINQVTSNKFPFMPYSPHHEEHYIGALKIAKDNPIFGIGTNLFRDVCDRPEYVYKRSCNLHPHNYYIQLLAETGIVGLLFLIMFYGYFCYFLIKQFICMIFKNYQKLMSFDNFIFIMILVVFWWPVIPTMSFYNNWNNVFLMLPLGFLMRYLYDNKSNGNIKIN